MAQALSLPTCSPPGRMEALGQRHMARDRWFGSSPGLGLELVLCCSFSGEMPTEAQGHSG